MTVQLGMLGGYFGYVFLERGLAFWGDFQYTQPGLSCVVWSLEIYGKGLIF